MAMLSTEVVVIWADGRWDRTVYAPGPKRALGHPLSCVNTMPLPAYTISVFGTNLTITFKWALPTFSSIQPSVPTFVRLQNWATIYTDLQKTFKIRSRQREFGFVKQWWTTYKVVRILVIRVLLLLLFSVSILTDSTCAKLVLSFQANSINCSVLNMARALFIWYG